MHCLYSIISYISRVIDMVFDLRYVLCGIPCTGAAGVRSGQQKEEKMAVQTMSGAFSDLDGLMARAKEMVRGTFASVYSSLD